MELMLGNEAVARGAWEAGAIVATAYPGTPSTEILENVSRFNNIYTEWAPNEKTALEVALGASMAGGRALCCMKHVGVNVAADPLFTAAYMGINGGLVIVCADDPGIHSSQNEQDSRYYAKSAHIPMLEPSDSAECLEFTKRAFEISEEYGAPVMIRLVTRVAHARSVVEPGERLDKPLVEYKKDMSKFVMMTGFARQRHIFMERRERRLSDDMEKLMFNRAEYADGKTGVICSGSVYNYVKEALPGVSVLKLGIVYPLDEKLTLEFAANVETLYIIEELEPFLEEAVRALGVKASGKDKTGVQGELFTRKIAALFGGEPMPGVWETQNIPARPPVLCPGCPHRAVFYVLGKLKMTVFGDIGCYTLGALAPLSAMDSEICMGASIGMAAGFEKARGAQTAKSGVAVLGDSTFIHSGITGLINVVYNKANTTVIILDNSTTGMTGHQPNPATGKTIRGETAPQLSLEKLCEAVGVPSVRVVDPFDMKAFEKIVKEETARECPSVIIARRPCALIVKDKRNVKYTVNAEKCIACGACVKLGCPAILKNKNSVEIDVKQCVGCGLCPTVCPKDAITTGGA
jgi:indolepyruvate ferredoxin oxidoreductase alpha subunit